MKQFFGEDLINFVHLGNWSNTCRNAITTSKYPRSQLPEIIDFCEARHDLADCQLNLFPKDVKSPETMRVSPLVSKFLSVSPTLSDRVYGILVD